MYLVPNCKNKANKLTNSIMLLFIILDHSISKQVYDPVYKLMQTG